MFNGLKNMIKKVFFSTTILALILSTGSTFSASLSSQKASVQLPKWKGLYAGLNAGGIWSENTKNSLLSSFVPGSQNSVYPYGGAFTGGQSALGANQHWGPLELYLQVTEGFLVGGKLDTICNLRTAGLEG